MSNPRYEQHDCDDCAAPFAPRSLSEHNGRWICSTCAHALYHCEVCDGELDVHQACATCVAIELPAMPWEHAANETDVLCAEGDAHIAQRDAEAREHMIAAHAAQTVTPRAKRTRSPRVLVGMGGFFGRGSKAVGS